MNGATPGSAAEDVLDDEDDPAHFGIGLWLVRRNVEALGGRVSAANLGESQGLAVQIDLPLAR